MINLVVYFIPAVRLVMRDMLRGLMTRVSTPASLRLVTSTSGEKRASGVAGVVGELLKIR